MPRAEGVTFINPSSCLDNLTKSELLNGLSGNKQTWGCDTSIQLILWDMLLKLIVIAKELSSYPGV